MAERNEFLEKTLSASEIKKSKIANWLAILVILTSVLICVGFVTGSYILVAFLFIVNLLFGPVTLFFYLREVKRGVFKADEE
jgi:hypothetical protein